MNIYIDLSFLLQGILGYTSLYFTKALLVKKSKVYLEVIFSILIGFSIFLVYFNYFLSILIYLAYVSSFLIMIFKKDYVKSLFLYCFCYCLLTFIIDKLSSYNQCYNFILVINNSKGIISYLFAPIFLISLTLSIRLVDSLYHLHNYKSSCYLIKDNRKIHYSCYYDSGNTLKHLNTPVIFISKDKYRFKIENKIEVQIESINDINILKVEECLLTLEDRKESYYVYVALVDKDDFNGCEILLNAHLI